MSVLERVLETPQSILHGARGMEERAYAVEQVMLMGASLFDIEEYLDLLDVIQFNGDSPLLITLPDLPKQVL